MQLDLGYGDVIVPGATQIEYPTVLDLPAPVLRAYSRETVVAEKFEAMVKLGELNSRMKDFFDVWLLSRQFDFDGPTLVTAVGKTFANRKTALPEEVLAFTPGFASNAVKQTQWKAFLRKSRIENAPEAFESVVEVIAAFLEPVAATVRGAQTIGRTWTAPGPWVPS
jgi:hypothetical protein